MIFELQSKRKNPKNKKPEMIFTDFYTMEEAIEFWRKNMIYGKFNGVIKDDYKNEIGKFNKEGKFAYQQEFNFI